MRLTQARARADLRQAATADDARDAIELTKYAMRDLFRDSQPVVHVSTSAVKGRGVKGDSARLMAALQGMKKAHGKDRASVAELTVLCDELGLQVRFSEAKVPCATLTARAASVQRNRCAGVALPSPLCCGAPSQRKNRCCSCAAGAPE